MRPWELSWIADCVRVSSAAKGGKLDWAQAGLGVEVSSVSVREVA